MLAGGDVLSPAHVGKALAALPGCQLINGYGPTENTTFSCCHTIQPADLDRGAIPLGSPIGHTSVHILDEAMQHCPIGATGEIYLGGDGLALGYWRQPELTEAKFIADPFSSQPGARLYRSGDLGRWRDDGVVEFLGRADEQVKVSGYRIELGEIETALRRHSTVSDAAVIAPVRAAGHKEIVACVIPAVSAEVKPEELRAFLRQTLPDYMIPADFVVLSAFPLTGNGKVDRRALAQHAEPRAPATNPPRTEMERRVAAVWSEVIGRTGEINIDANFFDVGGNSLRAVEVHARLSREITRDFPLTALFQFPSIRNLAVFLDSEPTDGTDFADISDRALRQRAARARRRNARFSL